MENTQSGLDLYDYFFEIGQEFNLKAGCPNLIERIESGLLSYGNDMDLQDNPFECGFDKYVNLDTDANFLGKEKLKKIKSEGISRKLMGLIIEANEISLGKALDVKDENNNLIGQLRSACFSPHFKKVIGIAMINKEYWDKKTTFELEINGKKSKGSICDLPLV